MKGYDHGHDFRFITKQSTKQQIKHWNNVSWGNSRPHAKTLVNLSKTTKSDIKCQVGCGLSPSFGSCVSTARQTTNLIPKWLPFLLFYCLCMQISPSCLVHGTCKMYCTFDIEFENEVIGLLQLAVTWYMLEGKLPHGTSETKRLHQDKFEFSVLDVPVGSLPSCMCSVPCDR